MKKNFTLSFILELKLNTSETSETVLNKRFFCGVKIYNVVAKHCIKQIHKLREDKQYRELLLIRANCKKDKKSINIINKQLTEIRMLYGLSKYQLYNYVKLQQHRYKKYIDSRTAQGIAKEVWASCENVLFGNGKQLHFHRYDDFYSLESNSNDTGIRYVHGRLEWNGLIVSVQHDKSNQYEYEALKNKVKYCRIVRRPVGTKYHYYLQLVLEGTPPMKHVYGIGDVGIDIGTSTIATVSSETVKLAVLGEEVDVIDKQIRKVQRAMDRSKRATNSNNFNADGTVKKGARKWFYSHNYKQLRFKKRALEAKRAAALKQSHNQTANEIIAQGDQIYVEQMPFAGLQHRAKNTTKNSKGKFNKKKRFGKSLKNHAPAMLLTIIDRKLGYVGNSLHKVNTRTFRASQYNHVTDTYVKKKLSKRHLYINNEWIQRDLYSAFLLMNSQKNLQTCDREKCFKTYKTFKEMHDLTINQLKHSTKHIPSSFGFKKAA